MTQETPESGSAPKPPRTAGLAADPLVGQVLDDRYRLRLVLGEGGMGKVYLAEDTKLGQRRVALKLMDSRLSQEPEFRARFGREAVLQANLMHPQIIQIQDTGECAEGSYIVMEYSDGISLARLVRELGPRPLIDALSITVQILELLAFAHRAGVVHRDLKPSNILIEQRGDRQIVRLLDFGIAKLLGDGEGAGDNLTRTGAAYGTLGYMAPEQARGDTARVDQRADLYAAGVILYELITGTVPSPPESRAHPVRYALWCEKTDVPPLSTSHPHVAVPPALDRIVSQALERDLDRRYGSAGGFLDDLRRLQGDLRRATSGESLRILEARPAAKVPIWGWVGWGAAVGLGLAWLITGGGGRGAVEDEPQFLAMRSTLSRAEEELAAARRQRDALGAEQGALTQALEAERERSEEAEGALAAARREAEDVIGERDRARKAGRAWAAIAPPVLRLYGWATLRLVETRKDLRVLQDQLGAVPDLAQVVARAEGAERARDQALEELVSEGQRVEDARKQARANLTLVQNLTERTEVLVAFIEALSRRVTFPGDVPLPLGVRVASPNPIQPDPNPGPPPVAPTPSVVASFKNDTGTRIRITSVDVTLANGAEDNVWDKLEEVEPGAVFRIPTALPRGTQALRVQYDGDFNPDARKYRRPKVVQTVTELQTQQMPISIPGR